MNHNVICRYSLKPKGCTNSKCKFFHPQTDGKGRGVKRSHPDEYYHYFDGARQSKEIRISEDDQNNDEMRRGVRERQVSNVDNNCDKVPRKFVERGNTDYSIKSIQSLERAQGTTNRRNLEEEQKCHPTYDIHHDYEQIQSELTVVKDELEHSNHVIQELKVRNAKLNFEKDVALEKLETTIEEKEDLKAEVDRLNYFESFLLKEVEQKEAEIAKQTEICLKAESESQQVNAENSKIKCENHVLLQNLDIMMKDVDDLKLQCNEFKRTYDTKLGEIEENKKRNSEAKRMLHES